MDVPSRRYHKCSVVLDYAHEVLYEKRRVVDATCSRDQVVPIGGEWPAIMQKKEAMY